jgi:hypothetical protein
MHASFLPNKNAKLFPVLPPLMRQAHAIQPRLFRYVLELCVGDRDITIENEVLYYSHCSTKSRYLPAVNLPSTLHTAHTA